MPDFAHYLEAKRTVDDRAINRRVLRRLRQELGRSERPSIVDVGAGIGTGILRLLEWDVAPTELSFTAVERDADLLEIAGKRLEGRARGELVASTLADFAASPGHRGRFDLVMAHAFLDIVELGPALKDLVALARPGGLLYFPITFDGESIFEPAHDDDGGVLDRYHASMDAHGNSRTGRRLFHALSAEGTDVLELGSSDWIVYPEDDRYPNDEAFFLEYVIRMVEETVGEAAKRWAQARREQIGDAQLVYIAHQVDCLGRKSG